MALDQEVFQPAKDAMELFERLDWTLTPEQIKERTEVIMNEMTSTLDRIVEIPEDKRTFENTIWDQQLLSAKVGALMTTISFPGSVSTDPKIREASTDARQKLSRYFVEVGLREDIYQSVKQFVDLKYELDPKDQRLVDFMMRDYKRRGFHLDSDIRDQVKELWQENSQLAIEFRQNVNEVDTKLVFSLEELEGVSKNIINSLEQDDQGNYLLELSGPNIMAVMTDCSVTETRRQMVEAWNSRCQETNTELLDRMVVIRDKAAKLLGYKNHAEYVLEIKMAEHPDTVIEFLDDLITKLTPVAEKELIILQEMKKAEVGENGDHTIYIHDRPYYTNKWKEKEFDIDMEKIKQYFPLTHVVSEMLEFYQEIFGFTFLQINDAPVWHEDVTCYAIYDTKTRDFKGVFYLDLFPRPGTFGHAAAFTLIKGLQRKDGRYQPTASAMVCNFNKPTEEEPSLLTLSQVRTLFHEFGHIIHQTTTTAKHFRFSGSSVQRDFVEACSQILENWIYEEEVITRISKHNETGEPIPIDYVDRLQQFNKAMPGLVNLRQLFFSKFDMTIHTSQGIDTKSTYNNLMKDITLIPPPEDTNGSASFGHVASGYDAGYYGYMWSNVISHDMYTRFKEEGPTSKDVGRDYRTYILEPGSEKDANELVQDFLGRNFNNQAFMEYLGLH